MHKKVLTAIFLIFLFTRLFFLLTFPPFIDEANYINWGQIFVKNPQQGFETIAFWRKQPLPFWLFGTASLYTQNPIVGARLVNLIITVPTFFIFYKLIKDLVSKKAALYGVLLYSLCPLFIFFSSTALIDQMLFCISVYLFFLFYGLKSKLKLLKIAGIGLLLGSSFWIKNTSLAMIFLSFAIIFKIVRLKLFLISLVVFLGLALPLVVKPYFHLFFEHNQDFTMSAQELMRFPADVWGKNLLYIFYGLFIYLTPGAFVLLLFHKPLHPQVFLFLFWLILGSIPLILSLKFIQVRYFLFAFAPLIPLMALSLNQVIRSHKKYTNLILTGVLIPAVLGAALLTFATPMFFALFPIGSLFANERDYAYSWPSGYGIKNAVTMVNELAVKENSIILALPDNAGSSASSYLSAFYRNSPLVQLAYFSPSKSDFEVLSRLNKQKPVYLVSSSYHLTQGIIQSIKIVQVFEKPGHEDYLILARVI